jgi:transcriptional regulator with XRE-family HTH domain
VTQTSFGKAVGLTFQQIQRCESGSRISASRLYEFAEVLDVPVSYFFEGIPADTTRPDGKTADRPAVLKPARCQRRVANN